MSRFLLARQVVRQIAHRVSLCVALCAALILPVMGAAQSTPPSQTPMTGLARLAEKGVRLTDRRSAMTLDVHITQAVPWRVFTLDSPKRLVLDFAEVDWNGADPVALASSTARIESVLMGLYRPGWSRMVIELNEALVVDEADMQTSPQGAKVRLRMVPTSDEAFAAKAGAPPNAMFVEEDFPGAAARSVVEDGILTVVIDPGHGGIDPGAEREGVVEKDLVLAFSRELRDSLLRQDWIEVHLTRDDDIFVPLEARVSAARSFGADLFISIHADALAEGRATGATVYTLSQEASDVASEKLAERHDRGDLLAGVDLSHTDDAVALVLMDLVRNETAPRSALLADAVVEGLHAATQSTYKTPRMQAGFSVLKAPDIPSILVELGFLSSQRDREKLLDPEWRRQAAEGIRDGVLYWALNDEAARARLRK
ncbi:MAG: N-acetylmuramoyl-L-alanine amidase [Maritimibacter sp.]